MSKAYYDDVRKRGEEMERLRAENAQLKSILDDSLTPVSRMQRHSDYEMSEEEVKEFSRCLAPLQEKDVAYERYQAMQKVVEAAKQLKTIFMSADVLMVDDDLEEEFWTTYHSLKDALEKLDQ